MFEASKCLACHSKQLTLWSKAKDLEYFTTDEVFCYYRCQDCGALSISPLPEHRLSEIYPDNYYSFKEDKKTLVNRFKIFLDGEHFRKILKEIDKPELNVLDVGGGSGWILNQMKAVDPRVKHTQIVDLDPSAARFVEEYGHRYFCGRIEDFETSQRFDLILMLNLIEHVSNPEEILKKTANLLSPGGRILIKTPNYESWDAQIFRNANWGGYHCPRHWVIFTKRGFSDMAKRLNLEILKFQFTQGASFWSTSILFWMGRRRWIILNREHPTLEHPLYPVFNGMFAAFDFMRSVLFPTSQMFYLLQQTEAVRGKPYARH